MFRRIILSALLAFLSMMLIRTIFAEFVGALVGGALGAITAIGGGTFFLGSFMLGGLRRKSAPALNEPEAPEEAEVVEVIEASKEDERWLNAQAPLKDLEALCDKIDVPDIQKYVKNIYATSQNILQAVEEKPERKEKAMRFFENHLETLVSILDRYNEVEDKQMSQPEVSEFTNKTRNFVKDIDGAFERHLHSLYSEEIFDASIDMDVMKTLMKSEGLIENTDFRKEKNG